MKKPNTKHIALTVVALILALMVTVGITYSWIDDIKLVEFQNDNLTDNGAPLKTGVDINSTVNITSADSSIDLGNMLYQNQSALVFDGYTYNSGAENQYTGKHTKYDGAGSPNEPDWNQIDEDKGYFYESGDMHLSPCYSDGETFYFPTSGGSYREGNKDDENVNYISFTAKVCSPDATTDFWFESLPTIQGKDSSGSNVDVSSYARYAIIVDGECHVYSSEGTALTCNSGLTGTESVSGVRTTAVYTYGNNSNTTAERGANSNTLFSIQKGDTVNMTIKIWLEGGVGSGVTASDISLELMSSWGDTREIWIDDKTTGGAGESWLNNDSPKLYVTFPEFLKNAQSVSDWSVAPNGFYPITIDNTTHKGYVDVPLVYNNERMILYRCNSTYWNNYTIKTVDNKSVEDPPARSEYNVHCWNWWQTTTPNTYVDATYTLYGGSKDSTAKGYFNYSDGWVTDKGYGTWGEVEQIDVYSHYNNNDNAPSGQYRALYIVDYSDEDASGETYIYEMSRADNGSSTPWKTYVPATSSKIQFRYFGENNTKRYWGYNSWNNVNPQRRPLASTGLYPNNAKVYHMAAVFNSTDGWGYWKDSTANIEYDKVYLVKKGSMVGLADNAYDHLYDNNSTPNINAGWPGYKMTRMKDASNGDVTWNDGVSWVMQSDTTRPGSNIFCNVMFNNGGSGDGNQTARLDTFPGCFYNPDDGKWYGAINDTGRTTSSGGDDSGADVSGGSMDGYSYSGQGFVINVDGTDYTAYANSTGTGAEFKVKVTNLSAGSHLTTVKKSGTSYKNGQDYSIYETKDGINIYLSVEDGQHTNDFAIKNYSSGNFIITFRYDNGNTNTIKITSILKEG